MDVDTYPTSTFRLTDSTEIMFRVWGIPNPSVPEAFVYTGKTGILSSISPSILIGEGIVRGVSPGRDVAVGVGNQMR